MGKNHNLDTRIWELDFFRGLALILMVIFHLVYNLNEFYGLPIKYYQGIYYYIGKISVILFMFISGISCLLSKSNLKRGLKLLGAALLITIVTHMWNPEWGIKFGILHFLGVCISLYPLLKKLNTPIITLMVGLSFYIDRVFSQVKVSYNYLFSLGLKSSDFISSDYYPLFPWIAVFLLGIIFGRLFYSDGKSIFKFRLSRGNPISFIGRHTLSIYLVHQPILLLILGRVLKPK